MLILEKVLEVEVSALTDEQKAFLKENAEKLTEEQKVKYAEILADKELDVEGAKKLVTKAIEDAMKAGNLAKKVDEIATELSVKFMAGAQEARKKAIDAGAGDKKTDKQKTADEKTRAFIKALISGDKVSAKAMTTETEGVAPDDANSGILIPVDVRNEVIRIAQDQFGLARRDMLYLPFSGPGNTRTVPALGTSVSVFWTEEGEKKQSTQPKFALVTQTLKKLAAIVPFTEEILEDSAINLTSLIAQLFAEAVAKEEDLQFFAGTGSPWTGILNNANVNIVTQASGDVSQITAEDLLDMIDATPTGAEKGAKFYFHRTVLSVIRKLKDANGQYIFQSPANSLPGSIWDFPYETSDAFPAVGDVSTGEAYVLFGNLKIGAIFGDKQQLRVKLLDQATITDVDGSTVINLAEQDMLALRVVERVGYVVAVPKALTVLKAAATSS